MPSRARIRVCFFNQWAGPPEPAASYLERMPSADLRQQIARPGDVELLRRARLDCDWYSECARCFASMTYDGIELLPAHVVGATGLAAFVQAARTRPADEAWWLIFMAQQPEKLGALAGKTFGFLRRCGVRILYYAFDEASRRMPCFPGIAPHLDVLVHDEAPLAPEGAARLRADCLTVHRSWVANLVPFAAPFCDEPEEKILFLGSQLGLTPHRKRQIAHLQAVFKDRFVASTDHSVSVGDRYSLNRYKVGLCPEGRMFASPAMAKTHTDRPFWSGCLGMVPVSEDSREGGRLEELAREELIVRYAHGDLSALTQACERALAMPVVHRRRIYEHFNRHETVGAVVAEAIARFS
jgi:hypothetical protein